VSARGAALALLLALGLAPGPARALGCTLAANPIDFGTLSPLDAASADISSSFTASCTAAKNEIPGGVGSTRTANICVSYDNGSGGASDGGNRQLTSGANAALYDVYTTAARGPTHWGSRTGTPAGEVAQAQFAVAKTAGGGQTAPVVTTFTTYARLFAGQGLLPPGTYASTLTITVEAFWDDVKSDCGPGGAAEGTTSAAQLASVIYQSECRVGTISSLDFGASGFLTSSLDAASSVGVTCTSTTPYRIGLDAGTGAGATTAVRKMTRTTAPFGTVDYGLYRDLGRTLNWGNDTAAGTDTRNGTGTGMAASYPIYGRVPAQPTPSPGSYLDTVVLSVAF
jgi:spore coat protein U-like protein